MDRNFQHYRAAAQDINQGWLRGDYYDSRGRKCMVQGVLNSMGMPGQALPPEMVAEIDAQLMQHPFYRLIRAATIQRGRPVQVAIMAWNDTPWRRQHQVAGALASLADSLELRWLRTEHVRLTSVVLQLQSEVQTLKERIAALENDNSRLRRLTNSFTLAQDRRELQALSDELDTAWEQLQALPAIPE